MESPAQFKHFVDIAWRRKWWVVVPAVLAIATSLGLVRMTPKAYRATTTIVVTRHSVPEGMARSSVTMRIEERMRTLELKLFSRSYLEQIARKFEMVPANASESEIEETCRRLRTQIVLELDRQDFSWLRISVEDIDSKLAAGIANQLADLFIEENTRMRAAQATGTLKVTENWEQKYRLELIKRDNEISAFNQQNLGELPDQQPANQALLYAAKNSFAQLTSGIESRNDRLVALRARQAAQMANVAAPGGTDAAAGGEMGRVATLQRELADLLAVYTEENPLVKRKRVQIAEVVHTLPIAGSTATPANPATAPALEAIAVQIKALENTIDALERDRARENAKVSAYGAHIGNAPRLQPKFLELTRDSDQAKQQLDLAVVQNEQAQHAQDLEESTRGDQLQIQDRAYPPAAPFKPIVFDYLLTGIAVGLALGAGAAVAREFVDQTLRSEDELASVFPGLAVYGVIPSLDVDLKSSFGSGARGRGARRLA